MQFNSLDFFWFLPVVVILYYLLPGKLRWILLLIASYAFYMSWNAKYALLIIGSTLVDFTAAQRIYASSEKPLKKLWLSLSIVVNLGLLFSFKYYGFFRKELATLLTEQQLENWLPTASLLLPVGISFYTFQTLSYTIDVYRGEQKPEKHLGIFALYVSFFPQLVAGPIEKFGHLGNQLKQTFNFSTQNLRMGGRLILYGLFIKMCVADNLSPFVDSTFEHSASASGTNLLLGAIFYAFQIYADFHGYSLIAIGAARLLGVELINNFSTPYLATSISSFWRRWHISLTTWFREYLFIPLGGSKVYMAKWILNVLIVFIISGLWHGDNWTFIAWGAIHGVVYLIEKLVGKANPKLKTQNLPRIFSILGWLKTFGISVLAWIYFRSESVDEADEYIDRMLSNSNWQTSFEFDVYGWINLALLLVFLLSDILFKNQRIDVHFETKPWVLRWAAYAILLFGIMAFGGVTLEPFIYFQF
ncbi:MAG: MBOAT family protein [Bacteroidetes bacterium]|nr:MBOAT family protein [Bacteroidota bacterium]